MARWHIRLAKAAGIDAFLVSWWGGANISGKAFEQTVLPIAAEETLEVALLTSWNEWPETTIVEPSSSWPDPYQYLKILADWKGLPFESPVLPPRR